MPCLALTCNPEPRHAALRSETLGGPHKSVLALGLVYYNYQKKIEEAADRASPMPHHASNCKHCARRVRVNETNLLKTAFII